MTNQQIAQYWANEIVAAIKNQRCGYIWGQSLRQYMLGGFALLVASKTVIVDCAGNVALDAANLPCSTI